MRPEEVLALANDLVNNPLLEYILTRIEDDAVLAMATAVDRQDFAEFQAVYRGAQRLRSDLLMLIEEARREIENG